MKTIQPSPRNAPAPRLQAELGQVVRELFQRSPALIGFSVEEDRELYLVEVTTQPWLEDESRSKLRTEIAVALLELMDEEPAIRALLAGQTFARVVH